MTQASSSPQSALPAFADLLQGKTLVLLGCGNMGRAMLAGWLAAGAPASSIRVIDPNPEALAGLDAEGVVLSPGPLAALGLRGPVALVIAIKPQLIDAVIPQGTALPPGSLVVSIAAGTALATLGAKFGADTAIIRAMPNIAATTGHGATVLYAPPGPAQTEIALATRLFDSVGEAVWLTSEEQIDAATAISGSGPAYYFLFTEALAQAGEAIGLAPDIAAKLARLTLGGAASLAEDGLTEPAELRRRVTSPGGTTAAGLAALSQDEALPKLVQACVDAAFARAQELAK